MKKAARRPSRRRRRRHLTDPAPAAKSAAGALDLFQYPGAGNKGLDRVAAAFAAGRRERADPRGLLATAELEIVIPTDVGRPIDTGLTLSKWAIE